jgi:hypothetical protein
MTPDHCFGGPGQKVVDLLRSEFVKNEFWR